MPGASERGAAALALLLLAGCAAPLDSALVPVDARQRPHPTWKQLREQNVVMQRRDYSCGAAALATLLTHYFDDPVSEGEVLQALIGQLGAAELGSRQKDGFSLFDLQQFAQRRGYQAVGVRLGARALRQLRGPLIVYLETPDYRHFAVLRGVREDRVFLADPARGNIRLSIDRFQEEWPGVALALGKAGFGAPERHALAIERDAPLRPELRAARGALP